MTREHSLRLAFSIALALGVTACGGGYGGGIASMPTPTPTPTPTLAPAQFTMSAPDRASTGLGPASVIATSGGPNFTSGVSAATVFPLLQTAMIYNSLNVGPDTNSNVSGGTAVVQSGVLNLAINAYNQADVQNSSSGYANLDWTRVGAWETGGNKWDYDDSFGRSAVFVTGFETPNAGMPTIGTANYAGVVQGTVFFHPGYGSQSTHCFCGLSSLAGDASFTANFGTRNVSGSLTNMTADSNPWNNIAFNSTITGNAFSGTTSVTSVPGGEASLAANATGTIEGRFFGPSAQEAGAVWTLFDGTNAAIGTLSGKHP